MDIGRGERQSNGQPQKEYSNVQALILQSRLKEVI
jgi:hypothetical protein